MPWSTTEFTAAAITVVVTQFCFVLYYLQCRCACGEGTVVRAFSSFACGLHVELSRWTTKSKNNQCHLNRSSTSQSEEMHGKKIHSLMYHENQLCYIYNLNAGANFPFLDLKINSCIFPSHFVFLSLNHSLSSDIFLKSPYHKGIWSTACHWAR